MYDTPPTTFEALIAPCSSEVVEIARWLRDQLRSRFPQLTEHVSGGHTVGIALYSVGGPEHVAVGIQPGKDCVKFFLHDFELLRPSAFKLHGSGKHSRHIRLTTLPANHVEELFALAAVPIHRRAAAKPPEISA